MVVLPSVGIVAGESHRLSDSMRAQNGKQKRKRVSGGRSVVDEALRRTMRAVAGVLKYHGKVIAPEIAYCAKDENGKPIAPELFIDEVEQIVAKGYAMNPSAPRKDRDVVFSEVKSFALSLADILADKTGMALAFFRKLLQLEIKETLDYHNAIEPDSVRFIVVHYEEGKVHFHAFCRPYFDPVLGYVSTGKHDPGLYATRIAEANGEPHRVAFAEAVKQRRDTHFENVGKKLGWARRTKVPRVKSKNHAQAIAFKPENERLKNEHGAQLAAKAKIKAQNELAGQTVVRRQAEQMQESREAVRLDSLMAPILPTQPTMPELKPKE